MPNPLIILGASARAAAQAAIRAGYAPWCIDLFADRDLRAIAPVKRCPLDRYPHGMLELLADAPKAPVLFTGAMENHLDVVRAIAMLRPPLGSSPDAIAKARDPDVLATMPESPTAGPLRTAAVRTSAPPLNWLWKLVRPQREDRYWLRKPLRSGAGHGIGFFRAADPVAPEHYLQQFIAGTPISAAYTSDGWTACLLGTTHQLVGDPAFGADAYQYVGNIAPLRLTEPQRRALTHLGVALAQRCDLRGPFGIDLIMDDEGQLWPTEINPRFTAGMEVVETAGGPPALAGLTPEVIRKTASPPAEPAAFAGKAIAYAKAECRAPDLLEHFPSDQIADVPEAGEHFRPGRPVCTLQATAPTPGACLARLHELAGQLYTRLGT